MRAVAASGVRDLESGPGGGDSGLGGRPADIPAAEHAEIVRDVRYFQAENVVRARADGVR